MIWTQRLLVALLASCTCAERPSAARNLRVQNDDSRGGFARLRVNTLDKVKVEAISREEAIRMRQSGLRFHEVEHEHFSDRSSKNGKLWHELKEAAKEKVKRDFPWEEQREPQPRGLRTFKRQNAMSRSNATEITKDLQKVLAPKQKIRPTRIGGFLCAQFDLDLFMLSGGVFPGLLGIGLLGDIHYQPATQCFGWTAELYLMVSIGIGLYGMDFRVALVVIATLVVTERPLAAGSKDLVWELPQGFDTTRCHNKNPFSLIASTSKEGWSFVYTHILTKKYLKHAELEVQQYLDKNKQDIANFKRYLDLIEPPRALPAKLVSASQSQGLAQEGIVGNVDVSGSWNSDGITFTVVLPKNLRTKSAGVSSNMMQFVRYVRATVWQDLGDALLSQQSDDCKSPGENNYTCSFVVPARRGTVAFVQLKMAAFQEFSVPMQLDPSEDHFHFPASFRASRTPQDGTLSCQKLTAQVQSGCEIIKNLEISEVQLEVQVSSVQASASWTKEDFGEGAPWGITVPQSRHEKNTEEIHKALADSGAHGALVRVFQLKNAQILQLLQKAPQYLAETQTDSFRKDMWNQLKRPSTKASKLLNEKGLQPLMAESLFRVQTKILDQLLNAAKDVLSSVPLIDSLQVSEDLAFLVSGTVYRSGFGEKACSEIAVRAALNNPEKPDALFKGLAVCRSLTTKFYATQEPADKRFPNLVRFASVDTENVTKQLEDLFPDSKLKGSGPKWVNYGHRTVNGHNCVSIGFLGAGSPEECQAGCDRVDDGDCNTVVFEEDDGWCSLWKCSPWDTFPRQPGKILSIKTDVQPDPEFSYSDLLLFAGLPKWVLDKAASMICKLTPSSQVYLESLSKIPDVGEFWEQFFSEKVWQSPTTWPRAEVVHEGAYQKLLINILLEDARWMQSEDVQKTLHGQMSADNGVMISVTAEKAPGSPKVRDFFQFQNDFSGHAGNRWDQSFDVALQGCTARVKTSWVWQVPSAAAYYVRPAMVPVAQSLFAAYDQFVSKLPSYGEQVLQRLRPKVDKIWKASVLPYQSTDGRHLHRHLKKGEQDRVKVHKGEVATDDAVYNYPKAIKESKYRESPNFIYNVGLSVANLFLRVVGDVQALFHLYFADHPDWDGVCQSLPAHFNLLYEWETARVPSNWMKSQTKRKDMSAKPTHRAGETVSEQGKPLTSDGEAMIKNWHWVSKPRWFFKEDSRAQFFTQTAPAHGKDGWATPDASQLSAVMWPHVWCELIQQEWSTAAAAKEEAPVRHAGRGTASPVDDLRSLTAYMPSPAKSMLEKANLNAGSQRMETLFQFKVSAPDGGCPVRMVARDKMAVDFLTQPIVIGWGRALQVSEDILGFYRNVVSELADQEEAVAAEASKPGEGLGEDDSEGAKGNETPAEGTPTSTSRTAQLETLMDTLSVSSERWKTEGAEERGLRNALMTLWHSLFKNMTEADTHAVVEARRSFQEARDKLHSLVIAQESRVLQIGQHLDRLFSVAPPAPADGNASNNSDAEVADEDTMGRKFAIRFATVLTAATAERQQEAISMFNKIFNCIDVVARPEELPDTAFDQWTQDSSTSYKVEDVRNSLSYSAASSDGHDGVELFFEQACSLPPNTVFSSPEHERFERLKEPRPECERVVLGNAMMSIFPNLVAKILYVFTVLQQTLEIMAKHPSQALMKYAMSTVQEFVKQLSDGARNLGMDDDFYKAFSYRKDGSLVGRLWSNLPSALAEIAATLQMRQEGRKQWITESIAYRSRLKTARRGRVKELEKNKTHIPTKEEGCICREIWSGYNWTDFFPRSVTYKGCVRTTNKWLQGKGNSSWAGVCKTKQEKQSLETKCQHKYAACDPEASPVKPQFQIWRAADVLHADPVRLPLLQLDLYLHVDVRNRRADFCTPNFAPLMLDTNWHWSTSSWLPYDLRRSVCFGARIHPPGVSLAVTRCSHEGRGFKRVSRSTEWSLTGVAYLVSHYNTWGTGDGDMTHSWFGGGDNWGSKAMSTGWPNFLMADPGTWASSAGGSGYLQTASAMNSPSTFWFSLVAEVLSALSMAEVTNNENTTNRAALVKGIVVSAATVTWRLLQRYAVIPSMWDLMVGAGTVLKTFGDIGLKNLAITPFRNEHDVVLSFKAATQWTRRELDLKTLIGDLSLDQMKIIFHSAEQVGLRVKAAWEKYQSTAAGSAQDVHNLNRETLIELTRTYLKATEALSFLTHEETSQRLLQDLFRRCPGRPLWYKVHSNARVPIYTFWRPDPSAWISPALPQGTELMISQWDQDWLRVIHTAEEEDRYIPSRYITTAALQLVGDVVSTSTSKATRALKEEEVENILAKVSLETLQCWGIYIKAAKPGLMKSVIEAAWRTERERTAYADTSLHTNLLGADVVGVVDDVEVPLGFFSRDCVRNFFLQHYDQVIATANASVKGKFNSIFNRGKASRIKLEAKNSREVAIANTAYTDVGLSILTRLGFPFISLPGIFQLQPYLQLSVQYDVKQIIQALKARIRGNVAQSSTMESYLRRKNSCEQCIVFGQAFCDRQEAADAMLQKGHDTSMDACEPRTSAAKARCKQFFWTTPDSGSLFQRAVCPCYKAVSGNRIRPRWITSVSSCADISWPDSEIEELKRASKDRDWKSGFAVADAGDERIQIAQVTHVEPPKLKDCFGGYRCCGWMKNGGKPDAGKKWTRVRCVHMRSLYLKSSWLHPKSACKYYQPANIKGEWHHAEEACGDGKDEGHFTWDKEKREWVEESSELEHESVDGDVFDQRDNE